MSKIMRQFFILVGCIIAIAIAAGIINAHTINNRGIDHAYELKKGKVNEVGPYEVVWAETSRGVEISIEFGNANFDYIMSEKDTSIVFEDLYIIKGNHGELLAARFPD